MRRQAGPNRQPLIPFKILVVLLYSTASWVRRWEENGQLFAEARALHLSRQVRRKKDLVRGYLDFLVDIGAIFSYSKPEPGLWRVHLRTPGPSRSIP